nr:hypothetical protein [Tanacetum cinerariifolium]
MYRSDLKRREAYTAYSNPRGFIYQNKDKKNRLMRIDELHKFSDGTLNDVCNALDDRLKGIGMQYLPQTIWRKGDKDRAAAMIQAIDKMLKTRRIMRSLERFVRGRLPDDEEDTRSSHEYLNDLEEEYQARALLAKSKRFFKKGTQSSLQHKPELRPTKDFEAKYNKVKAKLALLSLSCSASKSSMVKNKWIIVEDYEWDEEKVSSDDNEMVKVKVHTLLEIKDNDDRKVYLDYLCIDLNYVEEQTRQKDLVFVKSLADDTKVTIPGIKRPWLSKAEGFILPNHDTSRILLAESQRNTTNPSVAVIDSLTTGYDLVDESSVCSTPLPLLKKLDGTKPIFGPKYIKSILRLKSTFKAEALKGVIINEPSSAPAKGNKRSSTSKVHSALTGKLKSVKIKDDPPLAIVIKELNDLKLQISKNQLSHSIDN